MPKWMQESQKTKATKQEKRLAKDLGGKTTPASGATPYSKGDIVTKNYLIESKATGNEGFRVTKEILEKIEREAVRAGLLPLLILELQDRRYYIFREADIGDYITDGPI